MKVTLLITSFNSISQSYYSILKNRNFCVDVVFFVNNIQMSAEIKYFNPDIIICPYLKKFIPDSIYNTYDTYILHPGIIGDKGAYSIDNALRLKENSWGVVIIKANAQYDSGDIYASVNFALRETSKASTYKNETRYASIEALDILLSNISDKNFIPTKQKNTNMHLQLTQKHRAINWQKDTTNEIINKINYSDSYPGVLDEILGVKCYLYGVHKEDKLKSDISKQILAKRDGAICISTIDGSVWISHLKEINKFKLPATYVLKDKLSGIKENRLPLLFDKSYSTFYEISVNIKNEIAYLYFNFHNGAFSSEQCIRLKYAFEYLKSQVKVVVLMGGNDFFSNGINLNILEDSSKSGEDGWSNINAMNDLVKSIIFASEVITIASINKNAGAGGVFLALACDKVISSSNTILNPHYKTLGLSGSEYHTYSLVKRVGQIKAQEILNNCLPISGKEAKSINLVDEVFEINRYKKDLEKFCDNLILDEDKYDDYISNKEDYLDDNKVYISSCRDNELKIMYDEFWLQNSIFHKLRYDFVYKVCPINTDKRLKYKESKNA